MLHQSHIAGLNRWHSLVETVVAQHTPIHVTRVFSLSRPDECHPIWTEAHIDSVQALCFDPASRLIVAVSRDAAIKARFFVLGGVTDLHIIFAPTGLV